MHRLGSSAIFLFKMANLKKIWGKIPWTSYSILLVFFRFRTVQGRNGEWQVFFSYLSRNLLNIAEILYHIHVRLFYGISNSVCIAWKELWCAKRQFMSTEATRACSATYFRHCSSVTRLFLGIITCKKRRNFHKIAHKSYFIKWILFCSLIKAKLYIQGAALKHSLLWICL